MDVSLREFERLRRENTLSVPSLICALAPRERCLSKNRSETDRTLCARVLWSSGAIECTRARPDRINYVDR